MFFDCVYYIIVLVFVQCVFYCYYYYSDYYFIRRCIVFIIIIIIVKSLFIGKLDQFNSIMLFFDILVSINVNYCIKQMKFIFNSKYNLLFLLDKLYYFYFDMKIIFVLGFLGGYWIKLIYY